jgi:hypothetical protein
MDDSGPESEPKSQLGLVHQYQLRKRPKHDNGIAFFHLKKRQHKGVESIATFNMARSVSQAFTNDGYGQLTIRKE